MEARHLNKRTSFKELGSDRPVQKRKLDVALESDHLPKLVKRNVNKLSVGNVQGIFAEVESLLQQHPRHQVKDEIANAILANACAESNELTLASQSVTVIAHIGLISMMHVMLGMEYGAHFLEQLAARFQSNYDSSASTACSNLMLLFSHLYNFQVIYCGLIYDLIRLLVEKMAELDVELLLILLKNSGTQLRKDDPGALREIILLVQEKAASIAGVTSAEPTPAGAVLSEFSVRVKFMLQIIYDLKNNKQQAPAFLPSIQAIQKVTKTLATARGVNSSENPLRVSWKDLTSIETRGRWWLVGSSWSNKEEASSAEVPMGQILPSGAGEKLLKLSAEQRMNTDVRRAIFAIIMSGEDYTDAFEKLLRMGLKNKQDREIVYVLMHCIMQEKKFNPYYAHLASKLCSYDHNFKFTFQFAYWDRWKQMKALPVTSIANLAHLLSHLILNFSLSLTILKIIEFDKLTPQHVVFFKLFFRDLFTSSSTETLISVFKRLSDAAKHHVSQSKDADSDIEEAFGAHARFEEEEAPSGGAKGKNSSEEKRKSAIAVAEGISLFFYQEELHDAEKCTGLFGIQDTSKVENFKLHLKAVRKLLQQASSYSIGL